MKRVISLFRMFGIDIVRIMSAISDVPRYFKTRREYWEATSESHKLFPKGKSSPCLGDHKETSGCGRGAYFYQDLWVAQQVFQHEPKRHIDVGSRVDGFVAHVAAFRELEVIDIRPLPGDIPHVKFRQVDIMGVLPKEMGACCDSVSCLHALEHFGLGRYGDPVDPDGWKKGFDNLWVMLQKGGRLYLSVPIGASRVEFNSHRVFSVPFLVNMVSNKFKLEDMTIVDDKGMLRTHVEFQGSEADSSFGCTCGCCILELIKS
jgi:SAM-dependent methyltransferase